MKNTIEAERRAKCKVVDDSKYSIPFKHRNDERYSMSAEHDCNGSLRPGRGTGYPVRQGYRLYDGKTIKKSTSFYSASLFAPFDI